MLNSGIKAIDKPKRIAWLGVEFEHPSLGNPEQFSSVAEEV